MTQIPTRITWARDLKTGRLVKADRAERKQGKGRYRCLDERCARDLTVARSKQGRQHFKHFRNGHAEECAFHGLGKSQTRHQAAQQLLATLFSEALKCRIPMPLFVFNTPRGIRTVLPFIRASEVVMEWVCPLTGRRIDVALLDTSGQPVLLIEVWHTHAVDMAKHNDLSRYWWIEVEANQVLVETGSLFIRNHDNLPEELELAWQQFELFSHSPPVEAEAMVSVRLQQQGSSFVQDAT